LGSDAPEHLRALKSFTIEGWLSGRALRAGSGDNRVIHMAEPDRSLTYARGPLGPRTGPLTVGAFNPATRTGKGDRLFRGLIDDIRVFGSSTDVAGAVNLEQIRNIQQGARQR
jgi:hypothetical protein